MHRRSTFQANENTMQFEQFVTSHEPEIRIGFFVG
jgi:hypothetical protein